MASQGLVMELQRLALDPNVPVSTLLRHAKAIAVKLDLSDALVWIDGELDGYLDKPAESLPAYRVVRGELKARNIRHGWEPVQFPDDAELAKLASLAHLGASIGSMEKDHSGSTMAFQFDSDKKQAILSALPYATDVMLELGPGQIRGVVEVVHNIVLDWALELEKQGISGEGMTFSADEKRDAPQASHNYFAQNISVIGDVSGQAQVSNEQTASIDIDIESLRNVVSQARENLPSLPEQTREELEPILDDIDLEIEAGGKNRALLRELAASAKRVCEGAAGNVVASGIVSMLSPLLS